MVELTWNATTPLSRIYAAGRHGVEESAAGLAMAELGDFELVQVMARRGQWGAVAQACAQAYGKAAPADPQAVEADGALLIWSGPDQFFVLSARGLAPRSRRRGRHFPASPRCRSNRTDAR